MRFDVMAAIFSFSSTGNSLYAAKKIAERTGGKVLSMSSAPLICEDDVIGFVFPVYFWGLPRMVERFVSDMQIANKKAYVFAVVTCGGPMFGVLGQLKRLLKEKGIRMHYGIYLNSGTNYIPIYEIKDSKDFRDKIDRKIINIADAINKRKTRRILLPTIVNKIGYRYYPNERSDQYFSVVPTCSGCSTCVKICPANNVVMVAGKPDFRHKCEHCLACLHNCPSQAIDWKQGTQGKERYRNVGVPLIDLIAFNNQENRGCNKTAI
jgi:ferredoxin